MEGNGRFAVCPHCCRISTTAEWDAGSDYLGPIILCPNTRCDASEQDLRTAKTMAEAVQIAESFGGVIEVSDDARELSRLMGSAAG